MIRPIFAQRIHAHQAKSMLIGEKLFDVCYEGRIHRKCVCVCAHELNERLLFHFDLFSIVRMCLCVCVCWKTEQSSFFCILNKSISMPFENNVEFKFQPPFSGEFSGNVIETPLSIMYIIRVRRTLKSKKSNWRFTSMKWHIIPMKCVCLQFAISLQHFLSFLSLFLLLLLFLFGVHKWKMCQIKLFQFRFWQLQYWTCIWTR